MPGDTTLPADLRLTGAIQGLLRRGSPATYMANGQRVTVLHVGSVTMDVFDGSTDRRTQPPCEAVTLDLTDPTGRYHALLWLRERGHDLRWAEDEPDVLAWSILSVERSGGPCADVLHPWRMVAENDPDTGATWVRHRAFDPKNRGGGLWACDTLQVWREVGWENSLVPAGPDCPWMWQRGPETGDAGKAAADRAALGAGYALRNEDGSLTLPDLPNVSTGPVATGRE